MKKVDFSNFLNPEQKKMLKDKIGEHEFSILKNSILRLASIEESESYYFMKATKCDDPVDEVAACVNISVEGDLCVDVSQEGTYDCPTIGQPAEYGCALPDVWTVQCSAFGLFNTAS